MGMWIGRNRKARVTYGFDEIALVPGRVTINPNEVDITWRLSRREAAPLEFKIPILASAMDGVVDVQFAIAMGKLGGLAVLNLGRCPDPLQESAGSSAKNRRRRQVGRHRAAAKDLPGTSAGRSDRGPDSRDQGRGRAGGGQLDSATRGKFRPHRAGSGCRHFCRAKHRLDGAPHLVRVSNRSSLPKFCRDMRDPGHRRQHRRLRRHP